MRLISWIITLLILLVVLAFTVKNNAEITLTFWPFDTAATMPLPLLVFALLFVGFFLGSLTTWFGSIPARLEARRLRKEVAALQKKFDACQSERDAPVPDVHDFSPKNKLPWFGP